MESCILKSMLSSLEQTKHVSWKNMAGPQKQRMLPNAHFGAERGVAGSGLCVV